MQPLLDALSANAGPIALGALVVAIVALAVAWRRAGRSGPPARAGSARLGPAGDPVLDRLLSAQTHGLDELAAELHALAARTRVVEAQGRQAIQSVGLVRFNPFEDTGSNQSFALALLDADDNGLVLTSLHSRQATRLYLKAIAGGRCDAALSSEESLALQEARGGAVASG